MNQRGGKPILGFNIIKPGLNFLVPGEWWAQFTGQNKNVSNLNDIMTPKVHPLGMLFEAGLLFLPTIHTEDNLASFKMRAQNIGQGLTQRIQQVKSQKLADGGSRLLEQVLEVLENRGVEEADMKVLLCLGIESQFKSIMPETFQWKIVTPHIYRAISSKVSCKINEQPTKHIIGIPIFLDQYTQLQDSTDKSYDIVSQIQADIFISNSKGGKYGVFGFLQRKMTYEELMRHLFEGLNNLMNQEDLNSTYFTKRSLFFVNNQHFYEAFMKKDGQERIAIRNLINLECWFDDFSDEVPSKKFEIFQFVGRSKEDQYRFKRLNTSTQHQSEMDLRKFVKKDEVQVKYKSEAYRQYVRSMVINRTGRITPNSQQQFSKTKGFQPTIIRKDCIKDPVFHQQMDYQTRLSTEQQTHLKKTYFKPQNRIFYPLWKTQHILESLRQAQNSDLITVPNQNSNPPVINLKCGAQVFLGGRANSLSTNSSGQMIEQETTEKVPENSGLVQDNLTRLQALALEIASTVQVGFSEERSEMVDESASERMSVNPAANRNDELDEAESRES